VSEQVSPLTERLRAAIAPLGEEEEQRAVAAALDSIKGRVQEPRLHGAEIAIDKPERVEEPPERRVRVLFGDRKANVVHEVLVEAGGDVISERAYPAANLPYLPEEIEEARGIAERDVRVSRRIERIPVGVGTFAPGGHDVDHRLVGLHFVDVSEASAPTPLTTVVVDLATGQVVSVEHVTPARSTRGGA
jgi:hypothetical protein